MTQDPPTMKDLPKTRKGARMIRFPVGYGDLKDAIMFRGRLILAFEEGLFYLDDDGFEPITPAQPAPPVNHASTAAGPVNCSTWKRHQGASYPRTCERCGLGPCPFYDKEGNAK